MKPTGLSVIIIATMGTLATFEGSAAQAAEPLRVENTERLSATIESINRDERLVELRSGDDVTTVQVPDEVRNFDQMKVGDEVVISYYQGIAAQFKKKGESKTVGQVNMAHDIDRAPQGARPAGVAANAVTTTVVIEAVDRPNNAVTFTGPSGMMRTVQVKDPDAQQFIGTLKKGDEVEVTYTEALAVAVQPGQQPKPDPDQDR